jgi:hypothetical protein
MTRDILYQGEDVEIRLGDLRIGDVSYQNVQDLLIADKGWYKFNPFAGVGATNYINDDFTEVDFLNQIQRELNADGFVVKSLGLKNGDIKIDGYYGQNNRNYTQRLNEYDGKFIKHTLQAEQTIFDLAMIYYANIEGAYRIFKINKFEIFPPNLIEGQAVMIDSNAANRAEIYGEIPKQLATGIDINDTIGGMIIGSTFTIE